MKKLLFVVLTSIIAFNAFAENVCSGPRQNVFVQINIMYLADNGMTFCYATELDTKTSLEILDCGTYGVGDVVEGRVLTHWTHKDEQGNPVCDYQQFVPYKL